MKKKGENKNKGTKLKIDSVLAIFLIIIFLSSAIKILSYSTRPVHHDEAVYNFLSKKFLEKTYSYDPEYHGPLMFMLQGLGIKIFGDNINGLRLIYLIFSISSLIFLILLKNDFETEKFLTLTILFSFSPVINYYSSYACWESGFLFFYILFLVSTIKIIRGKTNFIFLLSASSALMIATYESAIIILLATIFLFMLFFNNEIKSKIKSILKNKKEKRIFFIKALVASAIFVSTILLLFSVFFTQNPINNISKMISYNLKKTYTTGHNKPFYYYFVKILPLELPALVLFIYSLMLHAELFFKARKNFRKKEIRENEIFFFLAIIILAVLSIMPYKVPWLSFLYLPPFIFFSATAFKQDKKSQSLFRLLLILTASFLFITTIRLNFYDYDSIENTLAYVQATRELPKTINKIMLKNPQIGLIISKEYWPLPWYFRNITVDYYSKKPEYKINYEKFDFVITDKETYDEIKNENSLSAFNVETFEIRPYVWLYLFLKV
ncbi:MAG: flippase activity-associated protein Agl23 [Candidatus Woesearchaeota archaeon]